MLEPFKGNIFDPCCGSGGMFVQSEKFITSHGGEIGNIRVYGQESNQKTWKLCKMNLAIRGINSQIERGDSFLNDLHKELRADYVIANPPFNMSEWGLDSLKNDARWKYGLPSSGNANFAWVQHFIYHLNQSGKAGFVLANGSMSSNSTGEGEIRKNLVEADLIDCMIALPPQLFYNTPIPACLWFITKDKGANKDQILFINAKNMGIMADRRHRELTNIEIDKISSTYHLWKKNPQNYKDITGFCKSVYLGEVRKQEYVISPGRYTGSPEESEKDSDKDTKELISELLRYFNESKNIQDEIKEILKDGKIK